MQTSIATIKANRITLRKGMNLKQKSDSIDLDLFSPPQKKRKCFVRHALTNYMLLNSPLLCCYIVSGYFFKKERAHGRPSYEPTKDISLIFITFIQYKHAEHRFKNY